MTCRCCGQQFCYVCGQDWQRHFDQPGGFDHYQCRLSTNQPARSGQQMQTRSHGQPLPNSFEACRSGFIANTRDAAWQNSMVGLAQATVETFKLQHDVISVVKEAAVVSLEAREVLKFSYVTKFKTPSVEWRHTLGSLVTDLEVVTGKLEAAAGLGLFETEVHAKGFEDPADLEPSDAILRSLDLREILAHLVAVSRRHSTVQQLAIAVRLQTQRLLAAARAHQAGNLPWSTQVMNRIMPSSAGNASSSVSGLIASVRNLLRFF